MSLTVHTARLSYGGPDRFDVTRRTAEQHRHKTGEMHPGEPFAPSWAILRPALDLIHNATAVLAFAEVEHAKRSADEVKFAAIVLRATWSLYREAYTLEMRESYRTHRDAWDALLSRERVVLVCFCPDATRCHRTVLAGILAKLGATNAGEVRP